MKHPPALAGVKARVACAARSTTQAMTVKQWDSMCTAGCDAVGHEGPVAPQRTSMGHDAHYIEP